MNVTDCLNFPKVLPTMILTANDFMIVLLRKYIIEKLNCHDLAIISPLISITIL